MKKYLAWMLTLLLVFSGMTTLAEESLLDRPAASVAKEAAEEAPAEDAAVEEVVIEEITEAAEEAPAETTEADPIEETAADDTLIVGTTNAITGSFFTDMWGSNTADIDVRTLLHGYNLIQWVNEEGNYNVDPSVVTGLVVTEEETGARTYTFAIAEDLVYSDGTPITAKDYAFSILLSAAPEMAAIGGHIVGSDHIVGIDAYKSGEADFISGVRIIDDTMIAITVKGEYLPFFHELALLDYNPYPIHVIAPGCTVVDEGEGVCIRNADAEVAEAIFTAGLLEQTVLDSQTGYMTHPSVVSGPYTLVSFDGGVAEFEINALYKGNAAGQLPSIPKLVFKTVANADMMSQLASGEVELVNKATASDTLDQGLALVAENPFLMSSYARSGISFISFCCEQTAVNSQAVRQAVAMCLDKDALVAGYVGDYGLRADGYYGLGQWMAQLLNGTLAVPTDEETTEEELAAWDELTLDNVKVYELDTDAAAALLAQDGWTLNAEGAEFNAETDAVRCKEIDGEIVALDLNLLYPEGNAIGELFQTTFTDNLAKAGVQLTAEAVPMNELLEIYYRQQTRECDMIYLATNFSTVFDPSSTFDPSDAFQGVNNRTGIADEQLYQLTVDMRMTEPGDLLGYCQKWVAFQEYYAEVLPVIPVYSNVYFDFYIDALQDYNVSANLTWAQAIVGASINQG